MSAALIDIGINLTNSSFEHDLPEVVQRARAAGVEQMLVTGTSVKESQAAAKLAADYPQTLYATAGVHPHDAKSWQPGDSKTLKALLQQPQVVAVGECGLDFNRDYSPRDMQQRVFAEQLQLAADVALPLFLHERDAFEAFIGVWREHRDQISAGGVVHCFTGSKAALTRYLDEGFYIGITGWVCDERRGQELQQLVPLIPSDKLLIETDGPYLLPRDLKPKPKTRRNEPANLPHIAATIARLRGVSAEQIAEQTTANARRLFALPAAPAGPLQD